VPLQTPTALRPQGMRLLWHINLITYQLTQRM
jgi:hypothetical protein